MLKHWSTWLALRGLHGLFLLTPLALQYRFAEWLGRLAFHALKRRRHIAEVNIRLCFPELTPEQQQQLVYDNFIATARGIVELAISWWASDKTVLAISELQGQELLDQAAAENRGVLLIGAHYTSIDLAGRVIGLHQDLDITYKKQRNPVFEDYLLEKRRRSFTHIIEKNDMRSMIKQLKAGRVVWFAPDQDFGRQGSVFVPFFHKPAATVGNIGRILRLTGAKPLFYSHFLETTGNGEKRYIGRISDPFDEAFTDDPEQSAALLNRAIATIIRRHPEQYLWTHERFRSRAKPGTAKVYTVRKKKRRHKKGSTS